MKKTRAFACLVAVVALIAAPAGMARAGGGAGGSPPGDIPLFQCYTVDDGDDPRYVVTITDQFGTRERVHLGRSRLLCTPVLELVVERGPALTEVDTSDPSFPHLSCYRLKPQNENGPDPKVRITDPFGVQRVELEKERLLCAGATKEVLPNHPR